MSSWPHLLGKIERCVAKVFYVEAQVHAGALEAAMAEQVANGLERRALAQEMNGDGVPQAVRSLVGDGETTAARPGLECLGDRRRLEPSRGGADAQEDFAVRSEEHTSELQSPTNLVCRLLLE